MPSSQPLQLSLVNTTATSSTAQISITPGLRVNTTTPIIPASINVSIDQFVTPGQSGEIRVFVAGLPTLVVPVCFIRSSSTNCQGGGGTGNFTASPSSLSFTQTGSVAPNPAQISLASSAGFIPNYYTAVTYNSTASFNWLQITPAPGTLSTSQVVTVTPVTAGLVNGTYSATITLQPQVTGYNVITIPVTLTIGGTGTGFYASPSSLTFTSSTITQAFTIYAGTATTFSVTPSANLTGYLQINPQLGTAPASVQVTVVNISAIPQNTSGSLTVTPGSGSGYLPFTIPIVINSSGSTGSLVVSPTALTFNTTPGSTVPLTQLINVTSSNQSQQAFTVAATSTNSFLTAFASSTVTPATVTAGVNPSAISQAGTYTGYVTITPSSGAGAGVPITVPVTVNVGTAGVITPTPSAVTLTGPAGGTQAATGQVRLDVAAGVPAVTFTTTVATTSGGNWLSASAVGTAPGLLTVSASPTSLAPGTYQGTVTVTPTAVTPFQIPVTFTVTGSGELRVAPTSLSFTHLTTSTTPPASQSVQITSTGSALSWNATATSTGNWLQVTPATGMTGTNALTVSVNPTGLAVGSYTGSISVSSPGATNPAQTVSVALTVSTAVTPQISVFGNGASHTASQASPGLIASITGTDLGPATPITPSPGASGFPTTVGETRVLVDGIAAPLLYVSATQVCAIVPFEVAGRVTVRVQVEYRGQRSRELELQVANVTPGVFTANMTGSGQGSVLNQNYSVNGATSPAARGSIIMIYATGLGPVSPAVTTGTAASGASTTTIPVRVRIGGVEARVTYSGTAPGLVGGTYQVNAVIPDSVSPGSAVPVSLEAGIGLSQPTVTIAVQ